jgi:hypothetical protein
MLFLIFSVVAYMNIAGAEPGFQVRGAHLKKLRREEGRAKFFGVFRVKNHDFTSPPPWRRPCIEPPARPP